MAHIPMPPWKEHNKQFARHIAVANVEVVFERADVDIAVELQPKQASAKCLERERHIPYILLHILLAHANALRGEVHGQLRAAVIEEVAECLCQALARSPVQ